MFQATRRRATRRTFFGTLELIFHSTVYNIRKSHRNALAGLLLNIFQTATLIATFFLMFNFLGVRGTAIRGDFMLFLMSGIFLFMVHAKAIGAVAKAEGPTSSMMQHAPLTTFVTISASALGSLYLQMLSMLVLLFLYHVLWTPIEIEDPVGAMSMVLLSWLSGVGVGIIFFALRPWAPDGMIVASTVYSRLNMVASGKMFVANTLPGYMLAVFDWNPLFHTIDQARGYTFINYNPHFSSPTYPLWVSIGLIMVGLLAESYTRRHASISWAAGR
jgi:ABC-type polysaccharide/polyol phosphate export permease